MRLAPFTALVSTLALLLTTSSAQAGKGLDATRISLPKGPGSIEGLGRNFSASLSSGTSSYGIDLQVPPAAAGFEPKLSLDYDSGGGTSDVGIGWDVGGLPEIRRRTENGLPLFDAADAFEVKGLGPTCDLLEVAPGMFRPQYESGAFVRAQRASDGLSWEVRNKAGITFRFGGDAAHLEAEGEGSTKKVATWLLREQRDLHGHVIRYEWDTTDGHGRLLRVVYNDTSEAARNEVLFSYEDRPDPHTRFSTGIRETFSKRLVAIETRHGGRRVRRWALSYAPGRRSLLETVKMAGTDDTVSLPALTLGYTEGQLALDGGGLVTMANPPGRSPSDPNVDLTDLDGDGLPDLLVTKPGEFRSYLNHDGVSWKPGLDWPVGSSPSVELASVGVQLADLDGDGSADLVVKSGTSSFRYFPNNGPSPAFSASVPIAKVPSFTFEDPDVRLADMDGDRRIDAVITTEAGLAIAYNKGGTDWADPVFVGKVDDKQALRFSDGKTQLCDVNGDRVQDLCYLRSGALTYWLGRGRGKFEAPKTATGVPEWDASAPFQLVDLDGDGFLDLLRVGVTHVELALGEAEGAFGPTKVLAGAPEKGPTGTVKLADMNASGTTDLVWIDVSGSPSTAWRYLELFPNGRAGLLQTINNGLGKHVTITYGTAGKEAAAARDAGAPWTSRINVGLPVVKKIAIDSGLGDPTLTTLFSYRDGTYSPLERTFAGFGSGTEIAVGDASTPTLLTETVFDVGLVDRTQRGQVLSVLRKDESGRIFDRVVTTYTLKSLATALDGRKISYSFKSAEETTVVEGKAPSDGKTTLTEFEQDAWGNTIAEKRWGLVVGGDKLAGNDEAITRRTYAVNETDWLLGYVASEELTDATGQRARFKRVFYDGEPFVGLPVGQVVRGDLTREEAWVGGDSFELLSASKYDADGNPLEIRTARGGGRLFKWDESRTFPIAEGLKVSSDKLLLQQATYDDHLGTVKSFTNFNGAVTAFEYDGLGRLTAIVKPGDSSTRPTLRYAYDLGAPLSKVRTFARIFSGHDETEDSVAFTDGLGRKRGVVSQAAGGRYVLSPVGLFDARGNTRRTVRARWVDAAALETPALLADGSGDDAFFDAAGRLVRSRTQLGFESRTEFAPFLTKSWDPNQTDPSTPYEHTPVVEQHDGLGRLVAITRTLGSKPLVSSYGYDAAGALLFRVDPEGHTARYQYDGKGRRVLVDDPDAGKHHFAFDTSDNLVAHTHPGGVVSKYAFDLADRPTTDDWNGDGTPDIVRLYDEGSGPGMLTSATSPAGLMAFEYDARLRNTKASLTLAGQPTVSTGNAFDAQDRKYLHRYPDGSTLRIQYDPRGLIAGYGKDAVLLDHDADGRELSRKFATGVEEWQRYDNDRRRIETLARTKAGLIVQQLEWVLDPVGNITEIRDKRVGVAADKDRSEAYTLDNLYRLTKVRGRWGETSWAYSASGNILERTSTDPRHHAGPMAYGKGAGPHALTSFKGRTVSYDSRGRMLNDGDRTYLWNDADQLVSATSTVTGATATSAFDHAGMRRVRVEHDATGDHTTLFIDDWAEIKDGKVVRFIVHGGRRVARLAEGNGVGAGSEPPSGCSVGASPRKAPARAPSYAAVALLTLVVVAVHRHRRGLEHIGRRAALALLCAAMAAFGTPGCGGGGDTDLPAIEEGTVLTLTDADELMFSDAIGSATETTSGEGVAKGTSAVFPYGATRYDDAADVTRKYANTPRDSGVGLDQMGMRAYAPELGVWTSPDPIAAHDPSRAVGAELGNANAYAYAALRPTEFIDPSGAFGEWLKEKLAPVANVLGGVAYGTAKALTPGGSYIPISPNDSAGFKYGEAVGQTVTGGVKVWLGYQLAQAGAVVGGFGGAVTVSSAGAASPVSVPAATAGAAMVTAGVALMGSGAKDVVLGTKTAVDTFRKDDASSKPSFSTPYKRPSRATTPAQRKSVQGKPCVDCGAQEDKMIADHKQPLVKEYYETGTIDKVRMRSKDAVQSQCPRCSNEQGGKMSAYSKAKKKEHGLE